MPLRIAFDLDGVLADMESALARELETVFGEAMTRRLLGGAPAGPEGALDENDRTGDAPSEQTPAGDAGESGPSIVKLRMTARQERRLWRHVGTIENFWESLEEIEEGLIARLAQVAHERRWEVIFLTKRPGSAGFTAQVQTQRWLKAKGFPFPSVYVVQGNRGRIAASLDLDFVIDDRPENCLDVVVDSKARAILVWRDDEKQLPTAAKRLGIGVVTSLQECLNILMQVDEPRSPEKPAVMDRVMRLLGLKEAAKT